LRSAQLAPTVVRAQILRVAWIALAIAAASGAIWLQLQAVSMSGLPFGEAMTWEVLSTVLNETQFGLVSKIRFGLAIILAACLAYDQFVVSRWLALGSAVGIIAAIAWTGHAGSTPGETGSLHLTADALHLIAASAWVGGLVSLALLLVAARGNQALAWASFASAAVQRFSTLGIVSVATLLLSGIVNASILVGSFRGLFFTGYGIILVLKIAVFAAMLGFAAVNRAWLTPQLAISPGNEARLKALGQVTRNSVIEIALGLIIFALVGVLGTLHPASHFL
jgi:putative copper resistance protein D